MRARHLTWGLSAVVMALAAAGCSKSVAATRQDIEAMPLGSRCTVQFRRDFLGTFRDTPVPPTTGSFNGAETSISGKLIRATDQWLVLEQESAPESKKEFWIPMQVVLLVQIEGRTTRSTP